MNIIKTVTKPTLQTVIAFLTLGAGPCLAADPTPQAMIVNGVRLEAWEFNRELQQLIPATSFHRRVEGERRLELEREAHDSLVMKELKRQWAAAEKLPVDAAAVDRELAKVKGRFADPGAFADALRSTGITEADLRRAITRDVLAGQVDDRILAAVASPTESEVEAFFAGHRSDYLTPESRRVIHVLVPVSPSAPAASWEQTSAEAEALAAEARAGKLELAAEAAARRSGLSPSLRDQTGDLGSVHKGALGPELDAAVFGAAIGEVVGPVRTLYGFSVLEVLSVEPPRQLELDQVRAAVAGRIERERRQAALASFESGLRGAATIVTGP